MPKRTATSLDSDPSKLEDYIGACVKKLFKGYGEFKGHVSRVDRKAKDGMPIHIEYEDGDKGWMTFDEFSGIVVVDADGNLQYKEGKRKAKPAAESPAPPSKRSKKTPTPKSAGAGSSTGQPRGRSGVRSSGRSKSSQEIAAHGKVAAAADAKASGAANGDVESDTQPAVNGNTPTVDGDTPAAPGELPCESYDRAEAAAESQPESEAPDAHTTIDAATIEAAVANAEPAAENGHALPPRDAERIAEPPAGETSNLPKPEVKGIAKMLEHIQHNVHSQEDQAMEASTYGFLDATQLPVEIPPTAPAAFIPASAPAVFKLVPQPPELPNCPSYVSAPPPRPPTPPRPQQLAKYSQVVVHNGLVYISGQVPKDVMSRLGQTYYGQTQQVLHQLDELMLSVGVTKKRLLQVRIYLKNMASGREDFNRAWLEWVDQDALPARTMIEAKMVRESILVQIEATAALDSN